MDRGIQVGAWTTLVLGDVVGVALHSHGCDDDDCSCGGAVLHVTMTQADGQGCQVVLPLRSWAIVAAAVHRSVAEVHPGLLAKVLDHLDAADARSNQDMDFMAFLGDTTSPEADSDRTDGALDLWADLRPDDPSNQWVTIGRGKVHHVDLVLYQGSVPVEVRTSCGKEAEAFTVVTEARPEDLCKTCCRVATE